MLHSNPSCSDLNLHSVQAGNLCFLLNIFECFPSYGMEWNVEGTFIFNQMCPLYVSEIWEMSPIITKGKNTWGKLQFQGKKSKFRLGFRRCQIMNRNIFLKFYFFFLALRILRVPQITSETDHHSWENCKEQRVQLFVSTSRLTCKAKRFRFWVDWHLVW